SEGKCWELGQHGFARDTIFQLSAKTNESLTYSTKKSSESLKVYPYRFELCIRYELKENTLSVCYEVRNEDDKNIYFSIGDHPGFNWPVHPGEKFTDNYIEFEKAETADRQLLTDGLFNGKAEKVLNNQKIMDLSEAPVLADAIVLKN